MNMFGKTAAAAGILAVGLLTGCGKSENYVDIVEQLPQRAAMTDFELDHRLDLTNAKPDSVTFSGKIAIVDEATTKNVTGYDTPRDKSFGLGMAAGMVEKTVPMELTLTPKEYSKLVKKGTGPLYLETVEINDRFPPEVDRKTVAIPGVDADGKAFIYRTSLITKVRGDSSNFNFKVRPDTTEMQQEWEKGRDKNWEYHSKQLGSYGNKNMKKQTQNNLRHYK